MSVKVLVSIAVLVVVVATIVVLLWRKKLREAVALAIVSTVIALFARPVEVAWDAMLTTPTATTPAVTSSPPGSPTPTASPRPSRPSGTPRPSATTTRDPAPPPDDPIPATDDRKTDDQETDDPDDPVTDPVTAAATVRATIPKRLLGTWSGGGNQYPNDGFYQSVDVAFGDDGRYALVLGGALHDGGRYAVVRDDITFRSTQTEPYTWGWGLEEFGGATLLVLRNEYGGTYRLDRQ